MARTFSLIGPGRAGKSLAFALVDCGWQQVQTIRRGEALATAAQGVDLCVIATPDASIETVAHAIEPGDAAIMHLSGATPISVLGHHERCAGLHPLVALPDPERGRLALRHSWFGVAGDPIAEEVASELSGKSFPLADADRAIYHAAAVVASNHVVALLGQVERLADEAGVPLAAFLELTAGSVDNVASLGPAEALTGPAARGDDAVIDTHVAALEQRLPSEVATYAALVAEARRLAGRSGRED